MAKKLFFVLALFVIVASVAFFIDRSVPKAWLRVSFQKMFHGETVIKVGDRLSAIEFNESFDSPPTVIVTPKSRDTSGYRIRDITEDGFLLELYDRAATNVSFSWLASWDRWDYFKYYIKDAGLPEVFSVPFEGDKIQVSYTGAIDFIPSEFWVQATELSGKDVDDKALIRSVLDESFKQYNKDHSCSVVDSIKMLLQLRVVKCPPRKIDKALPKWTKPKVDDWVIQQERDGVRIVRSSNLVVVPPDAKITEKISRLIKTANFFDVMRHNNQVLDVLDMALTDSLATPLTIVHFDTHSDLSAYKDPRTFYSPEYIGDFMNTLISKGLVREVFWVIPDWTRNDPHYDAFWDEEVSEFQGAFHKRGLYEKGPKTLSIYVDTESGLAYMPSQPGGIESGPLNHVPFHKVTLDELPDLTGRPNVYLEIDADYLSNSGYRTRNFGNSNPSHSELASLVDRIATNLIDRGVRPTIVSLCLSPKFVSIEDRGYLTKLFLNAAELADLSDYLVGYRHTDTRGASVHAHNIKRTSSAGKLVLKLIELDAMTPGVDEKIYIRDQDAEYAEAVTLVKDSLGLTNYEAETILLRLDLFDGLNDGTIDLVEAEYYAALEDIDWIQAKPGFQGWPDPHTLKDSFE